MKIQLALNLLDLQQCIDIAKETDQYTNSLQIGSPLLLKYGIHAIEQIRAEFPNKEIFVETQIINHGQDISSIMITAGADWISVMAGTGKEVIHAVSSFVSQKHKSILLDLSDASSIGQSAMDANKLGVQAVLYHNIYNDHAEGSIALEEWDNLRGNCNLPIYISGNINRTNIEFIASLKPDTIIIGKSITRAKNPAEEAEFFHKTIQQSM